MCSAGKCRATAHRCSKTPWACARISSTLVMNALVIDPELTADAAFTKMCDEAQLRLPEMTVR